MTDDTKNGDTRNPIDIEIERARDETMSYLDYQFRASENAAKALSVLHGGLAISLATWIQSSLAADASILQRGLTPYLILGVASAVVGLCFAALLPLALERNVQYTIVVSSGRIRFLRKMRLGDSVPKELKEPSKDDPERQLESLEKISAWNTRWMWFFGLSWTCFAFGTASVVRGVVKFAW